MPVQSHDPGSIKVAKLGPGEKPKRSTSEALADRIRTTNFIMGYNRGKENSTHRLMFKKSQAHRAPSPSEDLTKMKEHFKLGTQGPNFETTNS